MPHRTPNADNADILTIDGRRVAAVEGSTEWHLMADATLTGCGARPAKLLDEGDMTSYDDTLCLGCDRALC